MASPRGVRGKCSRGPFARLVSDWPLFSNRTVATPQIYGFLGLGGVAQRAGPTGHAVEFHGSEGGVERQCGREPRCSPAWALASRFPDVYHLPRPKIIASTPAAGSGRE